MPSFHDGCQLDAAAQAIIRQQVSRLIGRAGFTAQDREDLEQELTCGLLQCLRGQQPDQATRNAFIATILANLGYNLIRGRLARKRDYRRTVFLPGPAGAGDGDPAAPPPHGQEAHARRTGRHPRPPEDLADLRADVADILARLPAPLRELAERLMAQPIAQVAEEMGVPRTTLNDRVRRLRKVFEDVGLKNYLETGPSARAGTV